MRICPYCQQTYRAEDTADGLCPKAECRQRHGLIAKGVGRVVTAIKKKRRRHKDEE